jgi:hypothetical protein
MATDRALTRGGGAAYIYIAQGSMIAREKMCSRTPGGERDEG